MREILLKMLKAWCLRENSWVTIMNSDGEHDEYERTYDECYTEVCDGNVLEAGLLGLFAHWENDIQTYAAHYGLQIRRADGGVGARHYYVDATVPPAPSVEHYWDEERQEWIGPADTDTDPDFPVAGGPA